MLTDAESKMEDGTHFSKMPEILRPAEGFGNFKTHDSRFPTHMLQNIHQGIIVNRRRKILHPLDFCKKRSLA